MKNIASANIHLLRKQGTPVWLIETDESPFISSSPDGDERSEDFWLDANSIRMRMDPEVNCIWDLGFVDLWPGIGFPDDWVFCRADLPELPNLLRKGIPVEPVDGTFFATYIARLISGGGWPKVAIGAPVDQVHPNSLEVQHLGLSQSLVDAHSDKYPIKILGKDGQICLMRRSDKKPHDRHWYWTNDPLRSMKAIYVFAAKNDVVRKPVSETGLGSNDTYRDGVYFTSSHVSSEAVRMKDFLTGELCKGPIGQEQIGKFQGSTGHEG